MSTTTGLDHLDPSTIDRLLSDYIHSLYYGGAAQYRAANAVFGLEFFNGRLKGRLQYRGWPCAAGAIWSRAASIPPLTWDVAVLIALQLRRVGQQAMSVAVLLMFDCYLRIGEMADLRVRDIVDSSSARMGSTYRGMAVILRRAKTGRNQSVDVRRPVVRSLVQQFVRGMPAGRQGVRHYGCPLSSSLQGRVRIARPQL